MTPTNIAEQLTRDEGTRTKMYLDTKGIATIGIGHNLRAKPLSAKAIAQIFEDDLTDAHAAVEAVAPWCRELSEARYGVLVNMAFWMGEGGLAGFRKMLAALRRGDFATASSELLDSELPIVDEGRAHRLATQLQTDTWT